MTVRRAQRRDAPRVVALLRRQIDARPAGEAPHNVVIPAKANNEPAIVPSAGTS